MLLISIISCQRPEFHSLFDPDNNFTCPSDFDIQRIDLDRIRFTRSDNSLWETGFRIDKKIGTDDWQIAFGNTGENMEEWIDENVEFAEIIFYRLSCFDDKYSSDFVQIDLDNPPSPKEFTIDNLGNSSELSWHNIQLENEDIEYGIYKNNILIEQTENTFFVDNAVFFGDEYYYYVNSHFLNSDIYSEDSEVLPFQIREYEEGFNSSTFVNWIDDGSDRWNISGSRYYITGSDQNDFAYSYFSSQISDFCFEVEMRKTNGSYASGIFFRSAEINNIDNLNLYLFSFDVVDKYYSIWKIVNGEELNLIPWTGDEFIYGKNSTNKI